MSILRIEINKIEKNPTRLKVSNIHLRKTLILSSEEKTAGDVINIIVTQHIYIIGIEK
jgi:hypothetical protein